MYIHIFTLIQEMFFYSLQCHSLSQKTNIVHLKSHSPVIKIFSYTFLQRRTFSVLKCMSDKNIAIFYKVYCSE